MSEAVTRAIQREAQKLAVNLAEDMAKDLAEEKVKKVAENLAKKEAEIENTRLNILHEGEKKSLLRVTLSCLLTKFGDLSEEFKRMLSDETIEHLESILKTISEFQNEQDVMNYLVN